MGKKHDDDTPRRITIAMGDEPPEANSTLYALLRTGEKSKPGDANGTLLDRLGAEVQEYLATQTRVAKHRRTAVAGSITITIKTADGPDGSHGYAVECKTKPARIPAGVSMTFADEDGELTGRPGEPLTDRMYERERANKTNPTEPKVGGGSSL